MARKNYPWNMQNIKFGTNIVVNMLLFIGVIGFYAIFGLVYLFIAVINWLKSGISKKNVLLQKASEDKSQNCYCQRNSTITIVAAIYIITIAALLFGGIIWHKYYSFPIYIKNTKNEAHAYRYDKYKLFFDNRTSGINPIFWETPISWEKTKYDLRNVPTTHILFHNDSLAAEIELDYHDRYESWGSKLESISLKIPYKTNLESDLIKYYGEKYIHMYYPKTGYYHNTWLFDQHFVSIERRCNNDKDDYLYIRISILDQLWRLGEGAYFNSNKQIQSKGPYADSVANLSFHNIVLGEHKRKSIMRLKKNANVCNIENYNQSEYGVRIRSELPNKNSNIYFDTKLVFYEDTLAYMHITSDDKDVEFYKDLYIEKYKSENAVTSTPWDRSDEDYIKCIKKISHTIKDAYKWIFKNQSIILIVYKEGNWYKGLEIVYKHNNLYNKLIEERSLQAYENKLKEEKGKREAEIADSIKIANRKKDLQSCI